MAQLVQAACPHCKKDRFELRVLKDEGVASARCIACGRHFLLLDSGDYWFDVIQCGYPRLARCTCKGQSFRLAIHYELRDGGDVRHVWVISTCAACGKVQQRLSIDIDYSPTRQLVRRPLVPCKNPEVLYDLHELTLYATPADMVRVVEHLAELGCSLAGVVLAGNDWKTKKLSRQEVKALVAKRSQTPAFQQIYALPGPLAVAAADVATAKKESSFWKRREVIRFDAPFTMVLGTRQALLYYVHFSNEYVAGDAVRSKSARFRRVTAELVDWLGRQFVTWRGKDCFDNEQVHRRVFGDKFRAKAK